MSKKFDTQEDFLLKARKKHGDSYSYEKVVYTRSSENIEITCPVHGSFWQKPFSHLIGSGCSKCAFERNAKTRRKSTEEFVKECLNLYPDYDYTNTVYTGAKKKVKISCPTHGEFEKIASDLLVGQGCPDCAVRGGSKGGFTRFCDSDAYLYFIECHNEDEIFYKIGITSKELKERFRFIPYSTDVISYLKAPAADVWDLEMLIKQQIKQYRYKPSINFYGKTECFKLENDIITQIKDLF